MGIITLSKEAVCNLSASRLGDYGGVTDIDSPEEPIEIACSKWWDLIRQYNIKELKPNFALERASVAADSTAPAFGYSYRYRKPADCLAVLGFGEVQEKENVYVIEGDYILTDEYEGEALELRYIKDVEEVTSWTPEFVVVHSTILAYFINMEVTQDVVKQNSLEQMLPIKKAEAASLSGMENRPIRITNSKFKKARTDSAPKNYEKK